MPDTPELSDAKRALFEKYLRGDLAMSASAIAERIQQYSTPKPTDTSLVPVIPIQTSGSKRPFFYLHPHIEGGAFYSFNLVHHLGLDQPFYVLDPYKFDDLQVPPTLEVMATAYIETMRTIQPEGPYLLGGFCGGCLIAYEMAQQLTAAGQAVDLLFMIEAIDGPAPFKYVFPKLTRSFISVIGNLLRLSLDQQLNLFLYLRHLPRLRHSHYRNLPGFSLLPTANALRQDWLSLFVWVISAYDYRPYRGKVTYLWASEKPSEFKVRRGDVAPAKEIENLVTPGTHITCRTTYVRETAEHLRACLEKVYADSSLDPA
jgi:hypothetical protein